MPYTWVKESEAAAPDASGAVSLRDGAPVAQLRLWPYRSLSPQGFVVFFGITALLVAVPLLSVIGSPVLWGVLPFFVVTLAALWWGIKRSWADKAVVEELRLWPDRVTLSRRGPRAKLALWEANPYWVQVRLHPKGGPVPDYVTLRGAGREVEIGAFLSEEERRALYGELRDIFRRVAVPA
jgi:uncharacterized membrane protein